MNSTATEFSGVQLVSPKVITDERGSFFESFRAEWFSGIRFIQDNEATSVQGVIRGLHYQRAPFAQTKLIRVVEGEVLDVIVDLRTGSETFGKVFSVVLSATNKLQLLVPKGFAHGYATLSDTATVLYKVDQYYNPTHDTGIHPLSASLAIDWQVDTLILSEKDKNLAAFNPSIQYFK
jgi:dTDP-4-dehydrorhamnose 3,5-epimerase